MEKFDLQYLKDKFVSLWVDSIENKMIPEYSDNGDKTANGRFAYLLKLSLKSGLDVYKNQIQDFKKLLTKYIEDRIFDDKFNSIDLSTDYNPCWDLSDICEKSGINENLMPWKSHTTAYYDNENNVNTLYWKFGYSGKIMQIWENQKVVLNPETNIYEGLGSIYHIIQDLKNYQIIGKELINPEITYQQFIDEKIQGKYKEYSTLENDDLNDKKYYHFVSFNPKIVK